MDSSHRGRPPTVACSARPLHELAKHLSPTFIPPQPSSANRSVYTASSSPPHSFRLLGGARQEQSQSHESTTGVTRGTEAEWDNFARGFSDHGPAAVGPNYSFAATSQPPKSQLEAMPPYATTRSQDADADASPCFSPEQQTLSAIQSGLSSPSLACFGTPPSTFSPYLNHGSNGYSNASSIDLPTAEEAFSVASTPPILQGEGGGHGGAHPLTMEATSYNRWDFDQLFTKRRRWNEGSRGFFDEDESMEETTDESSTSRGRTSVNALGRRTSRSAAGRVLVERSIDQRRSRSLVGASATGKGGREPSLSRLSHEILRGSSEVDDDALALKTNSASSVESILALEERQKAAFEQLRKVAMERLKAVGSHLEWDVERKD